MCVAFTHEVVLNTVAEVVGEEIPTKWIERACVLALKGVKGLQALDESVGCGRKKSGKEESM